MPKRTAAAHWEGSLTEGRGSLRLGSGAYEGPYSFARASSKAKGPIPRS
jgi:osmotically inducible protein OsmC